MGVLKKKQPGLFTKEMVDDLDLEDMSGEESESELEPEEEEDEEEEEEEESEEDKKGDILLTGPEKKSIYNRDGLFEKFQDISWPEGTDWIHRLAVDIKQEEEVDVNDDLARELSFYNQALQGARMAFEKLESRKLPYLRPADYYAEMVKTDNHMEKVKGRLLEEKKRIEEAEERRKARDSKKIAKEVQAQKLKEKNKQKKEDFESVKKWRKQRQQNGFAAGDKGEDMGFTFDEGKGFERSKKKRPGVGPGDRSGGMARHGGGKGKKGGDKTRKGREHRDSKFGFGGKKGMKKQNTADTTNDFRGFNKGDQPGNKKRKR